MNSTLSPLPQALERILSSCEPILDTVEKPLSEVLGFTLAEDITSTLSVPGNDNSAMDGFAINCEESLDSSLKIDQRISAGMVPAPLLKGAVARIFTGAMIPQGANAVVAQEVCDYSDSHVTFSQPVKKGQNIRRAGQDISEGDVILKKGSILSPQNIGLIASVGLNEIKCFRKLRVGVFSTGDELLEVGESWSEGKIFNSNRFTIMMTLSELGFDPIDLGKVRDDFEETKNVLRNAASRCDCIVSSGGVSVGDEDHVKSAVETLGSLDLWRLAIKPGKPLAFGHVDKVPFFGLPGNPVAVFVTLLLVMKPYLLKKQGRPLSPTIHRSFKVPSGFGLKANKTRTEYLRVRCDSKESGELILTRYENQSSGVLSSVVWADGLAEIPLNTEVLEGDNLKFFSFADLLSGT